MYTYRVYTHKILDYVCIVCILTFMSNKTTSSKTVFPPIKIGSSKQPSIPESLAPDEEAAHADNYFYEEMTTANPPDGSVEPMVWVTSPNGEQVYMPAPTIVQAEVDPMYQKIDCPVCHKHFWAYINNDRVQCPKCHFPLRLKISFQVTSHVT